MADALISIVLGRLAVLVEEKIRDHVKLLVGVEEEVESLKDKLQSIQDFVEDAERKQVMEKSVQRWLERLKDVAYQIDDAVDEWITSLLRLQSGPAETSASSSSTKKKKVSCCLPSPPSCFKQVASRHAIALKIQGINLQLDVIDRQRTRFTVPLTKIEKPQHLKTTSVIDVSKVCGREIDQKDIIGYLLGGEGEQRSGLYIVSIFGTGGMGKTTLAQLAYNHPEVEIRFDERIWLCVSNPFEPIRIFRDIVEHVTKQPCQLQNLGEIQNQVQKLISRKKFLLVLDDVWTEDFQLWDQVNNTFSSSAGGSRILVTTRNENVVKMIGSKYEHRLGELSQEESRALFSQIAFFEMSREKEDELKAIGEGIADRCKGLPLAIKTLGNLMRSKNSIEEWEAVLKNELWLEAAFQTNISRALWLSYYNLPPAIKRCFSFCAVFPKDKVIKRDEMIKLWMAHNYLNHNGNKEMEVIGKEYFEHLAAASFFQDFKKDEDDNIITCKMHDIVHDFAQLLTKGECFIIESRKQSQQSMESGRHATFIVQDVEDTISTSMENLHTLLVSSPNFCDFTPSFQHLTCLRALSLDGGCLTEKLPSEVGELVHLRYLDLSNCWELPKTICNLHNLQTLSIRGCDKMKRLPNEVGKLIHLRYLDLSRSWELEELPETICNLHNLRTLNIRGNGLKRLPNEVGKLIHLRYLDLTYSEKLEELPETICNLYNLQILNIQCCGLKRLPQAIGKLTNLRHLQNSDNPFLESLPKGIGGLSSLRTLGHFIISSGNGDEKCRIGDLRNLNKLRGQLKIEGLNKVEDASEVEEAKLEKNLEHIHKLILSFGHGKMRKDVAEAIKLPPKLKDLQVWYYEEAELPGWMMRLSSLTHFSRLLLYSFPECSHLPPLGELPALEYLEIDLMHSLKYVGDEFLGSSSTIAFPKLKWLSFKRVDKWEMWEIKEDHQRLIMPSLEVLKISNCPKLEALPDHLLQRTELHHRWEITCCPILMQRYENASRTASIMFRDEEAESICAIC